MRRLLLAFAATAALTAAAAENEIVLTSAQRQALNVTVAAARAASELPLDRLPTSVRAPLQDSAVITAPYAGTVVAVLAREGESVRRGQALARVQSREAMALGAELAAARAAYAVADAQARRDRSLLEEGIIAAARAEESAARSDAARERLRELEAARALAPAAAGAPAGTYEVRATIDGRVLERSLRLGEPVGALAKAFVVARRDRVMLELRVPARYAAAVRPGQRVRTAGGAEGRVVEVGAAVDPASQSVLVRAEAPAQNLLPGEETAATLALPAPAGALELPAAALVRVGARARVFAQTRGGFRPVDVDVLAQTGDGRAVVRAPLPVGTPVAATGTGALKAMLGGDK